MVSQALSRATSLPGRLSRLQVAGLTVRLLVGPQALGDVISNPARARLSHALRLAVSGSVPLSDSNGQACMVPVEVQVPLAKFDDSLLEEFDAVVESTAKSTATCVAAYVVDHFNNWLAEIGKKKSIDLLGINWKVIDVKPLPDKAALLKLEAPTGAETHAIGNLLVEFDDGRVTFSLKKMESADRKALGEVLLGRLKSIAGPFFGEHLPVTRPAVGQLQNGNLFAYADVTLNDLPYFRRRIAWASPVDQSGHGQDTVA